MKMVGPALLLLAAANAMAQSAVVLEDDVFTPNVNYRVTHDSNLFRQHDNSAVQAALGTSQLSDTMQTATAGLKFKKKVSLQGFDVDASLGRTKYSEFTQFNSDERYLSGGWRWAVGSHLSGSLTGAYSQALSPFNDFLSLANNTDPTLQKNVVTRKNAGFRGNWELSPSWRVVGGYGKEKQYYDLASQAVNNGSLQTADVGLDYVARTGSSVGLQLRNGKGKYDLTQSTPVSQITNDYQQHELNGKVVWQFSEITQMQVIAGYVRRTYDTFSERNSGGLNARAIGSWKATSKLGWTVNAWNEVGALNYLSANVEKNRGIQLDGLYDMSAKTKAGGTVSLTHRNYNGFANTDGLASSDHTDRYQTGTLKLTYFPTRHATIETSVGYYRLLSNISQLEYSGKTVSLNMRYDF
ncbi:MAG: XrtB/PEP-CTERM-associated polysaccharide biosynthesis outer membrane protein EpsL [Janthinobacterium lividum]